MVLKKNIVQISRALGKMVDVDPEIKTRLILVYFGRRTLTKDLLPYARRIRSLRPQVRNWKTKHRGYIRAREERRREVAKLRSKKLSDRRKGMYIRVLVHSNRTQREFRQSK